MMHIKGEARCRQQKIKKKWFIFFHLKDQLLIMLKIKIKKQKCCLYYKGSCHEYTLTCEAYIKFFVLSFLRLSNWSTNNLVYISKFVHISNFVHNISNNVACIFAIYASIYFGTICWDIFAKFTLMCKVGREKQQYMTRVATSKQHNLPHKKTHWMWSVPTF